MIYPSNFEQKVGFDLIREELRQLCLCPLGQERVDNMSFSSDIDLIRKSLSQTREYRQILSSATDFPLSYFIDIRAELNRICIEGSHLDEKELHDLILLLDTVNSIVEFFNDDIEREAPLYPTLDELIADIDGFPSIVRSINNLLDKDGRLKDTASPTLSQIRNSLQRKRLAVTGLMGNVMRRAIASGIADKDTTPAMRDGRLVIPISPMQRKKIRGIVHDESASGKTVFIEPEEIVEANNHIRQLENDEKREILRILISITSQIRPHLDNILHSLKLIAQIDYIQAKAALANRYQAIEPTVENSSNMDWTKARHPLLMKSLERQQREIIPLDIQLTDKARLLIVSGPNAGGKSVCLKTVGLLQYMLQCGLSIPIDQQSKCGIFTSLMIDIGDGQSIDDDLSTYSGHLRNMKAMLKNANSHTLLLIDEMGSGTEPQIGGAIAESIATKFVEQNAYGIITTHYQNLKHFADAMPNTVNGAMLYDRKDMKPLFKLSIGRPGSSFAVEIARQAGLPDDVIAHASEIVGSDYIQSDKYLQDIVRDKKYWENKRRDIRQREKELENKIAHYESIIETVSQQRHDIIKKAQSEAQELLQESNKRIENTIRQIREIQAEREETRNIRQQLKQYSESIQNADETSDENIEQKMKQIEARRERHRKRKEEKEKGQNKSQLSANRDSTISTSAQEIKSNDAQNLQQGDQVKIKGLSSVGTIISIDGTNATIAFGTMHTKQAISRLEKVQTTTKASSQHSTLLDTSYSRSTRETIDNHRNTFHPDLDVRGMRGDEALNAVMHFIDDAILMAMPRVRILHGKGNGILRQLIRQYLSTVTAVSHYADEHVQFGGAGITVVEL